MTRAQLVAYYGGRTDHPKETRDAIVAKILAASDWSIKTDRSCEGKHWWYMDFEGRNVCPYCGWELTKAPA